MACSIGLLGMLAASVSAQPEPAPEPTPLAGESLVYATGEPQRPLRAMLARPDVVIDGEELRSYGSSLYEIEEPLALRAGIGFHSTGDTASEDWLLVRGLPRDSSRNVLVLIDGMPINNAAYEGVEFHDLPLPLVLRAEVYKPPLPAQYGGYHAVIDLITREPAREQALSVSASLGSLATQRAEIGASGGVGPLFGTLMVGALSTDNLTGMRRTPPFEDLRYEDRSYWDVAPTLLLEYRPHPDTRVRVLSLYSRGRKAFSDDEYRNRWFLSTNVLLEQRLGSAATLRANVYRSMEHYFLRLYMHPDVSRQDRVKQGARADVELNLPLWNTLRAGAEFTYNDLDHPGPDRNFSTWGAFVMDEFAPVRWFSLSAGLRYDGSDVDAIELNPSVELRVAPWPATELRARYSRSTRWPALGEVADDVELTGEALWGPSLSVRQGLLDGRLSLTASAYYLTLDGELVPAADTGLYDNTRGTTVTRGLEFDAAYDVGGGLRAFASYAFDDVRDLDADRRVAYGPPAHSAAAGLFYARAPYVGRISARYIGKKRGIFRHAGQNTVVADSLVVDLYLRRQIVDGFMAFLNIGNLFNLRYETFQGRPMMPRTVVLGVECVL